MATYQGISNILGDDLVDAYVRRLGHQAHINMQDEIAYINGIKDTLTASFDDYVFDHLNDADALEVVKMKSTSTNVAEMIAFVQSKIPDLESKLEQIFSQLLEKELHSNK